MLFIVFLTYFSMKKRTKTENLEVNVEDIIYWKDEPTLEILESLEKKSPSKGEVCKLEL